MANLRIDSVDKTISYSNLSTTQHHGSYFFFGFYVAFFTRSLILKFYQINKPHAFITKCTLNLKMCYLKMTL